MRVCLLLSVSMLAATLSFACGSSSNTQVGVDAGPDSSAPADGGADANDAGADADASAPSWALSGLDGDIVATVAADRKNAGTAFVGISAGSADKGVWRTKDGGKSWSKLSGGLPDRFTSIVAVHPQTGTIFANPGADGVWHSNDGGDTWTQSTSALTDPGGLSGLLCHPTSKVVWIVSSQNGVFRSDNDGVSFTATPNTNLPLNQFGLGPLAYDGSKLYLGTYGHGVYVSTDGGDTWTQAASANLPTSGAASEALGMAASPSRPGVLYVKTNGALFKSTDGGASFTPIEIGGSGARYATILMDPSQPTKLWASANETNGGPGGLFETQDDGKTWTSIGPDTQGVGAADVAADGTLYAGTIGKGVWRRGK
jgi:hypothetical protein